MSFQDGDWSRPMESAGPHLRAFGRGLADLILPPLAHDTPRGHGRGGPDSRRPGAGSSFWKPRSAMAAARRSSSTAGPSPSDRCAACLAVALRLPARRGRPASMTRRRAG